SVLQRQSQAIGFDWLTQVVRSESEVRLAEGLFPQSKGARLETAPRSARSSRSTPKAPSEGQASAKRGTRIARLADRAATGSSRGHSLDEIAPYQHRPKSSLPTATV